MPSETAKASLGCVTSYGAARRGGYTGTYEEWCALMAEVADHLEENIQLNEDSQAAKAAAETAELEAEAAALTAESWAKGTKGGTDVPSTDPAYHDNAKYYAGEAEDQKDLAEQAASAAAGSAETAEGHSTDAEAWAAGTRGGEDVESGDDAYHNNAKYYSEQSSGFADDAAGSASDAEAWAKGTKNGTDVPSTDPTYHNNAKYWSEQAEETAEDIEASSAQIAQNASDIGDLKTQVSAAVAAIETTESPSAFSQGGLDLSGGITGNLPNRIYTPEYYNFDNSIGKVRINIADGWAFTIREYSEETKESFIRDPDQNVWITDEFVITPVGHYYRFSVRKIDDANIAPSDFDPADLTMQYVAAVMPQVDEKLDEKLAGYVGKKPILTSGDDMDDVVESGIYSWAYNSIPQNCPVTVVGTLLVLTPEKSGGNDHFVQIVYTDAQETFVRNYTSNGWGGWQKNFGKRPALNASNDLDLIFESGIYTWKYSSIPQHFPITAVGTMVVFAPVNVNINGNIVNYTAQVVYTEGDGVYYRRHISSGWGDWHRFVLPEDLAGYVGPGSQITSSDDLDTIRASGMYAWIAVDTPTNAPEPNQLSTMLVMTPPPASNRRVMTTQIVYTPNDVYYRIRRVAGWSAWIKNISTNKSEYQFKEDIELEKLTMPYKTVTDTMPILNSGDFYPADRNLTGVVYSNVFKAGHDVAWNINPSTYYSAMKNPASRQYTEDWRNMHDGLNLTAAYYGTVCSSTAAKVGLYKYPYITDDVPVMYKEKRNHQIENLSEGDILWKTGHCALVSAVHYDGTTVTGITVVEQGSFVTSYLVTAANWASHWANKGWESVYYGDRDGEMMPSYPDNDSIIFELGNNTYVDLQLWSSPSMQFYFGAVATPAAKVYAKGPGDADYIEYALTSFKSSTVNGATVYDLAAIFKSGGDYVKGTYYLHTDVDETDIAVMIIDTGTFSANGHEITISGFDECYPVFARTYGITTVPTRNKNWFNLPDGKYYVQIPGAWYDLKTDGVFTPKFIPASGEFFAAVYYYTPYGLAFRHTGVLEV
jgi:hypothetical protein